MNEIRPVRANVIRPRSEPVSCTVVMLSPPIRDSWPYLGCGSTSTVEFMATNKTPGPQPAQQRGTSGQTLMNRVVLAGLWSPLHRLLDGGTIGIRTLQDPVVLVTIPTVPATAPPSPTGG